MFGEPVNIIRMFNSTKLTFLGFKDCLSYLCLRAEVRRLGDLTADDVGFLRLALAMQTCRVCIPSVQYTLSLRR